MKHAKNLMISAAALLFAVAPVATEARAQDPSAKHGGHFLKCLSIVGLSDSQKADVKRVLETEKPVIKGLTETLKTDADVLKAALEHNPPDACAIGADVLAVHAAKGALRTELEKVKTNVEAVLTAEQKAKLEGCLEARQPPVAPAATTEEGDLTGE